MCGSNNYLGLTADPRVRAAARAALDRYGPACTGSRFLNGNLQLHEQLEHDLASFFGKQAALVFPTGYQTNLGAITALVGRADVVITDRQNHASIVDACRLSLGDVRRFAHKSMADLERKLQDCPAQAGKLVVVDGVFSMEGTIAPLPEIVRLCRQYGARLLVDDAHGCGVLADGRGTVAHHGLVDEVDLITITFSKAFASVGGAVLGDRAVIEFIRHHARPLIYSASMSPANTAAAHAALEIMRTEPAHSRRVIAIADWMRQQLSMLGYDVGHSETPIIPIMVGDRDQTYALWRLLLDGGVFTNPVVPPAGPTGMLRTSYMAIHTEEILAEALEVFAWAGRRIGIIPQPDHQIAAEVGALN
jgi:8-amino-7-oxononanoate synthase